MDENTTTTVIPDAPAQPGGDAELVPLTFEGLSAEDLEGGDEPTAAEPQAVAATPTPSPSPTPAPQPEATPPPAPAAPDAKGDVRKALKDERAKSKRQKALLQVYEKTWGPIEAERAKGAQALAATRPTLAQVDAPKVDKPATDDLRRKFEDMLGQGSGQVVDLLLDEAGRYAQSAAQLAANQALSSVNLHLAAVQEAELRDELADQGIDYDQVLREAGLFEALRWQGQQFVGDPIVARIVYGAPNWARKAYRLAESKLRKDGRWTWDGDEGETGTAADVPAQPAAVTPPAPAPGAPAAPAPNGQPAPAAVAEARREGARQVVEAVVTNAQRPRGIRVLRSAGEPPKAGLTPELWDQLERLMDRRPDDFLTFMAKNPTVDTWFMQGRPPS